jgi:hypothetical protein
VSVRRGHRGLSTDGCFATSSHVSRINGTVVFIVGRHDDSSTYDDGIGGIVSLTTYVIIVGRHDDSTTTTYDDRSVSLNDATVTSNRSFVIVGTQDGSAEEKR